MNYRDVLKLLNHDQKSLLKEMVQNKVQPSKNGGFYISPSNYDEIFNATLNLILKSNLKLNSNTINSILKRI